MTRKGSLSQIWKELMDVERIVLTTHVRPDGDGIASELALASVLRKEGKSVYIVNHDATPEMYKWLPGAKSICSAAEGYRGRIARKIDLSVLLDCSSESRIGEASEIVRRAPRIISIDHHESTDCFRDYCYINTEVSSIGEILFRLLPDRKRYLDQDIATCLYTSILWDTGSFAYSNTSTRVFRVVSKLLEYGVDPASVYNRIFNSKSIAHFRLLGEALKLLKLDSTGSIAYLIIPLQLYTEIGAKEEDNEGILEVIKGLKDIDLIIFLRQLDRKIMKGSLRSVNRIDCNYLASIYGGGGHLKASGFVVEGEVKEKGPVIVERLIREVYEKGWI
jgi:phosphoesterase RecJ-like protein